MSIGMETFFSNNVQKGVIRKPRIADYPEAFGIKRLAIGFAWGRRRYE
jgi:hypothetical protein